MPTPNPQRPPDLDANLQPIAPKPDGPTMGDRVKAASPEITGGIAGLLATMLAPESMGASLLIPPAIAGATTIARDWNEPGGPKARDVVGHMAANAIPGGLVAMGKTPALARAGLSLITPKLAALFGLAEKAVPAAPAAAAAAAPIAAPIAQAAAAPAAHALEGMVLPGGIKVLSPQGAQLLIQKAVELENAGAAPNVVAAVEDMAKQAYAYLKSAPVVQQAAQQAAGVVRPAAAAAPAAAPVAAPAAAKAATAAAGPSGNTVANTLRALLGIGSAAGGGY